MTPDKLKQRLVTLRKAAATEKEVQRAQQTQEVQQEQKAPASEVPAI